MKTTDQLLIELSTLKAKFEAYPDRRSGDLLKEKIRNKEAEIMKRLLKETF